MNLTEKLFNITHSVEGIVQQQAKGVPYKITSWNEVNEKIRAKLKEHRVMIMPRVLEHSKEGNLTVVKMNADIINVDNPSEKIVIGDYYGYGIDQSDKGVGKAITYAYRYLLMKLFMTSVGTEEDSEFSNPPIKNNNQLGKKGSEEDDV